MHGDLAGAEEQLTRAKGRAEKLGYPQRPYNDLYAIDMEIWVRTEVAVDRARALVAEMAEKSDRYGLDYLYGSCGKPSRRWSRVGGYWRRAIPTPLRWRAASVPDSVGRGIASIGRRHIRPVYWCVLGQLLAATGDWDQARARLDEALQFTADSGVRFYDAELLRTRAPRARTRTRALRASPLPAILLAAKVRGGSNCVQPR